jgi:hypothetical protein
MRNEPNVRLDQLRVSGPAGANCGAFQLGPLRFVVADGGGWDHVSVSCARRLPTWDEMDSVKRIVFRDDEVAMQLHISDARKVDLCRYCLHLWRPQTADEIAAVRRRWAAAGEGWPYGDLTPAGDVPLPPTEFV